MSETPVDAEGDLSDAQDKALMRRLAAGDDTALRELVEKYQRAVYGTLAKMLGDPVEAQDLAQQVFLRIYRAARGYRETARFKTWMFTILRNLAFNEHRRRGRATHVPLNSEEGEPRMDLPDSATPAADTTLQKAEMIRAINRAILALPEQQRLAVILRRYDELSYEQIAATLKTSVPATKSLLFRARETLRRALNDYLEE